MKTHFLSWTIAFMVASVAFVKPAGETKSVNTTNKNISLLIYKDCDYNADVYKNTFVQVKVTIEKVDGKNRTSVWTKTFLPTELADFPSLDAAIPHSLLVREIKKGKEHLEVLYTLEYNTNGQQLLMYGRQMVDQNDGYIKISI